MVSTFLIFVIIPLTSSIADGLAVGFVFYPLVKIVAGKRQAVHPAMYLISGLFLVYLIMNTVMG